MHAHAGCLGCAWMMSRHTDVELCVVYPVPWQCANTQAALCAGVPQYREIEGMSAVLLLCVGGKHTCLQLKEYPKTLANGLWVRAVQCAAGGRL